MLISPGIGGNKNVDDESDAASVCAGMLQQKPSYFSAGLGWKMALLRVSYPAFPQYSHTAVHLDYTGEFQTGFFGGIWYCKQPVGGKTNELRVY